MELTWFFFFDYIETLILERKRIDNFIILSNNFIAPGKTEMEFNRNNISSILKKYGQKKSILIYYL